MNWGHKITLVFIVFAIAILGMVYVASQQTNELQDEITMRKSWFIKQL